LHDTEQGDLTFAERLLDDTVASVLLPTELFRRGGLDLVPEVTNEENEAEEHSSECPVAFFPSDLRDSHARVVEAGALKEEISRRGPKHQPKDNKEKQEQERDRER
jgi:hypothetical protein